MERTQNNPRTELRVTSAIVFACTLLAPSFAALAQEDPFQTNDSKTGYIDNAIVGTQVRFRFDAAFDNDRPDRAEFFYAKCGCFTGDPTAPGPTPGIPLNGRVAETNVDYQDFRMDVEYQFTRRISAFVETTVRLLNPEVNDNTAGFGDLRIGIKYALYADSQNYLTFQLRTYTPTGDASAGLGTNHVSIEPALLYLCRLSERWTLEAELRDWIPIGGSTGRDTRFPRANFAGNVLRYGAGVSYKAIDGPFEIRPVIEFVGWTVLDGLSSNSIDGTPATLTVADAMGDTIVNVKPGLRISQGSRGSFYVGYGRALTGDHWYKDIVRVEYRLSF